MAKGAGKARKKLPKELAVVRADNCTGCEACIEVCPVDCIYKVPGEELPSLQSFVDIDPERRFGVRGFIPAFVWALVVPGRTGPQSGDKSPHSKAPPEDALMRPLTPDDLLPLEEFARQRRDHFTAHTRYVDRYRRVRLGP